MKACFLRRHVVAVLILGLGLALAGCVTQPSAPTNFFMLAPLTPAAEEEEEEPSADAGERRTVVSVETVRIAGYLNRPQIVTQLSDTQFRLGEFNRWADDLGANLTGVIAENLSRLLSAASGPEKRSSLRTSETCVGRFPVFKRRFMTKEIPIWLKSCEPIETLASTGK